MIDQELAEQSSDILNMLSLQNRQMQQASAQSANAQASGLPQQYA